MDAARTEFAHGHLELAVGGIATAEVGVAVGLRTERPDAGGAVDATVVSAVLSEAGIEAGDIGVESGVETGGPCGRDAVRAEFSAKLSGRFDPRAPSGPVASETSVWINDAAAEVAPGEPAGSAARTAVRRRNWRRCMGQGAQQANAAVAAASTLAGSDAWRRWPRRIFGFWRGWISAQCSAMKLQFLLVFVFLVTLRAGEPARALRVGAGQADITPDPTVLNWVTGKAYGAVLDPLAVHALVLDDGVTKAVLIRWDLVDVSESARDEVRAAVGGALKMPPENIMVHASHNHSAPWSPVWRAGARGRETDTWWAIRYMPAQNEFPPFKAWMERLLSGTVKAAKDAANTARVVTPAIGRIALSEYLHNRRPRAAAWGIVDPRSGAAPVPSSPEWNPELLSGGATFGPMDRTLSLVSFRDAEGKSVAALFHVACHAVSIYPSNPAISGDWPGATARAISAALGGEALFLQGTCGDINPWRRGAAAVAEMAAGIAKKTQITARYSAKLAIGPLRVARTVVELPLTTEGKKRIGGDTVRTEIQAIVCGPLALVALPGEPMTELGAAIRASSPFPQTLVMGYTNGNGAHYVGMPGEKARGGYEAGVAGAGTDECGPLMVEAAVRLLRETAALPGMTPPVAATRR